VRASASEIQCLVGVIVIVVIVLNVTTEESYMRCLIGYKICVVHVVILGDVMCSSSSYSVNQKC